MGQIGSVIGSQSGIALFIKLAIVSRPLYFRISEGSEKMRPVEKVNNLVSVAKRRLCDRKKRAAYGEAHLSG